MSEEIHAEEVTSRYAVEAFRLELREGFGIASQRFFVVMAVFVLLCFLFGAYMTLTGLGALKENTRVLHSLDQLAVGNREMLRAVQEDLRVSSARFELIRGQMARVERLVDRRNPVTGRKR